jgi:hypothetical protein
MKITNDSEFSPHLCPLPSGGEGGSAFVLVHVFEEKKTGLFRTPNRNKPWVYPPFTILPPPSLRHRGGGKIGGGFIRSCFEDHSMVERCV